VREPPDNGRDRAPVGRPGLDTSTTMIPLPSATLTVVSLADQPDRVVVDLDAWRWRPWPGWWGSHHLATWSVAERSRGRWSS
jgi:hypothetical protein